MTVFLLVALVYVSDVGGARQPMADTYFGLVERLVRPVSDSFSRNMNPSPKPSPS